MIDEFDAQCLSRHPGIQSLAKQALGNKGLPFHHALRRVSVDTTASDGDRAVAEAGMSTVGVLLAGIGIVLDPQYNSGRAVDPNTMIVDVITDLLGMLIASDQWLDTATYDSVKTAYYSGAARAIMADIVYQYLVAQSTIDSLAQPAQDLFYAALAKQKSG